MRSIKVLLVLAAALVLPAAGAQEAATPAEPRPILLDDFESYDDHGLPVRWKYIDKRQQAIPVTSRIMATDEYFVVREERGNKFLRAVTQGRAHRLILPNKERYTWNLSQHPRLAWEWRANKLPVGAREDQKNRNDTGGAIYVTFSRDALGRPRSIKYTYSSTLPVGTVATYGRLKVLVVSSGKDGSGSWKKVERDVREDYRRLFGDEPPAQPVSIMIWSDSDSMKSEAEVDFDNFRLLPG